MKRAFCLFGIILCLGFTAKAGDYPPEWVKYTLGGYIYDIQSDINSGNQSETEFKNRLLNIARTNLAKQIQVQVNDFAVMTKHSDNNGASVSYSAETKFSTDINIKLVETITDYDRPTNTGYAIAYIDRSAACSYYRNELTLTLLTLENSCTLADNYIKDGFKVRARETLELAQSKIGDKEQPLFWMNIFSVARNELAEWQERFNNAEQKIKRMLAELEHGTAIYISCTADLFGKAYPTLQNELKGLLSANGCSFSSTPDDADWIITVNCSTREHQNSSNAYFSYVDAYIAIDKTATRQRIYEDEISVKGGHTAGYPEAAKTGYKDLKNKLGEILIKTIQQ